MCAGDEEALYDICLRTGDAGQDATELYDDPGLPGAVYVGPYLALEGCVGFVATDGGGAPTGYAIAARDTRAFEQLSEAIWWPPLRDRYADPGPPPLTSDEQLMRLIHRPAETDPEIIATFPSHLHIDLLPSIQGRGVGRRLIGELLDDLASGGSPGVHLGVDSRNERAIGFYRRLGFGTVETTAQGSVMARLLP